MIREANIGDLPYFATAAQEFIQYTPFELDIENYLDNVIEATYDPDVIIYTSGEGHAAVRLVRSLYCRSELIARVFTTWGKDGLRCFRACEQWAKDHGARYLMADSLMEPRIETFYQRHGMTKADQVYIKEL